MLTITKRSGTKEPFNVQKIKVSLAASSDDAGQPFNESDLAGIVSELEQMIEGKQTATSSQIYTMLIGILYTKGFHGVLDQYIGYKKR